MIDFSAEHLGFVVSAYGLSAVCLIVLAVSIIRRDRRLRGQDKGK
jgi:heme exporter protein CcmD